MFFLDVWLLNKIFFNPTSKLFEVVPATTVESKLGRLVTGNVNMETAERNQSMYTLECFQVATQHKSLFKLSDHGDWSGFV